MDTVHQKNDVLNAIIELLSRKGLKYDAGKLLDSFINCGILDELGSSVLFRYRRFQEFFVAGYLRDNPETLTDVVQSKFLEYSKELDLFTGRFRQESALLSVGRDYLQSVPVVEPKMDARAVEAYLKSIQRADFSRAQLRQMRREPMTAEKVDALLDKAEKRVAEKRRENEERGIDRGGALIQYMGALELYSHFIRNLEFVDKEQKQFHLRECFIAWERTLRGMLSVLVEAIREIRNDIQEGKGDIPKDPKVIDFVESLMASFFPSLLSQEIYRALGSEKLAEFVEELACDIEQPPTFQLLCLFVLLELNAPRGFQLLREFSERDNTEDWMFVAITQRLFAYYSSRPLSLGLRGQFENLVADIQMRLAGGKRGGFDRGRAIVEMKRHSFKERKEQ